MEVNKIMNKKNLLIYFLCVSAIKVYRLLKIISFYFIIAPRLFSFKEIFNVEKLTLAISLETVTIIDLIFLLKVTQTL